LLPDNTFSKLYIVVSHDYLNDVNSTELYQLHFETSQLHDKDNDSVDFYQKILKNNTDMRIFFENILIKLAKLSNSTTNTYIKYLVKFGRSDLFFETLNQDSTDLILVDDNIPLSSIPDNISNLSKLQQLIAVKNSISKVSEKLYELSDLQLISFVGNKLRKLPNGIGKLKNLVFLNLFRNPIVSLPKDIHLLDKSNGGNLEILILSDSIPESLIGEMKNKLPNVKLTLIPN
jgi:Leucine-rich repeat (LRR) protein